MPWLPVRIHIAEDSSKSAGRDWARSAMPKPPWFLYPKADS